MGQVHYFQRYSQRENVVTNNTLLLFSRLYNYSTAKFQTLLNGIFNEDVEIGINIFQQQKSKDSVPDGYLSQKSVKIVIETKLHSSFDSKQLKNHLKAFDKEEQQFLLGIGTEAPSNKLKEEIQTYISQFNEEENKNVVIIFTTFKDIINHFNSSISDYDFELKGLVNDYEAFCIDEELIPKNDLLLRMVLSGPSFEVNIKSGLYFDPEDRGYSKYNFIGLYTNKAIRAIGKIENIIVAELENDELKVKSSTNQVQKQQIDKIINAITLANSINGWNISKGHKFHIVEKFIEIEYKKASPKAPFGTKVFNLKDLFPQIDSETEIETIGKILNSSIWF